MRSKWTSILATGVLASGGVAEIGISSASAQAVSGGLPTAGAARPMEPALFGPLCAGCCIALRQGAASPYAPGCGVALRVRAPRPPMARVPHRPMGWPGIGLQARPPGSPAPAGGRWPRSIPPGPVAAMTPYGSAQPGRPDGRCRSWPWHPDRPGNDSGFGFGCVRAAGHGELRHPVPMPRVGPLLGRHRGRCSGKEAVGHEEVLLGALARRLEPRRREEGHRYRDLSTGRTDLQNARPWQSPAP